MSARKTCARSGGASSPKMIALRSGSITSSTRPATLASAFHSGGSLDPLCRAKRGSRRRSSALTAFHMLPNHISPSTNSTSVPLIRGDPSRRRVAIVLCLKASKISRARAASAGASASTCFQVATPQEYHWSGT
jgi:hypothetical protein